MEGSSGGSRWNEYQRHVLAELERLNRGVESLAKSQAETREEVAGLRVKAGVWGAVAGLIPVILFLIGWLVVIRVK